MVKSGRKNYPHSWCQFARYPALEEMKPIHKHIYLHELALSVAAYIHVVCLLIKVVL